MDVFAPRTPKGLLALAVTAVALLGLALSAVTWRNLVEQRQLIDQHVLYAARTILRGVESNLMRVMPMLGRMQPEAARERLEDVFREMAESGDVLFVGVYDDQGRPLLSSAPREIRGSLESPLDPLALSDLAITGEWFGTLPLGGVSMLGYAARMRPGMARFCPGMREPGPGEPAPPVYFLVGLSLDEHYAQFVNFRNAALMQTGFVLGAAALLWVLLVAYLRRREQGRKLVRLESFHSKLLDSLPEGLLTVDASGIVSGVNPAAKAMLGPDLLGRPFAGMPLCSALDGCPEASSWRQISLGGRDLEILSEPLDGETLFLVRDRTTLRSLERDLEQARHLAAVGRLAAGVAHEIRNPLSALRGFAQFFAGKLAGKDPEESYANTMVQEADRLGRVVTDLLYLARPRPVEPVPVDLPGLAGELERLLRFDLERYGARLATDFEATRVLADADGLKQALINLILNALAALAPEGGTVTLASRDAGGGAVTVSVADDGRGMSGEERARALEPFFTTKKEGSGLGLAIVHKIARDHDAALDIWSEPGQGTRVTLTFGGAPPA
jgi:signal transduction histidine kinase